MKIEKINENKLKVTIPVSYFVERNINFEDFDYTSDAAQEFFCELMGILEDDYGFSFLNSQMIIESSSDHSDNVVFTLTKPSIEKEEVSILQKYLNKKHKGKSSCNKSKVYEPSNNVVIYEFESFDDLCNMSEKSEQTCKIFNSLYKLNDCYYLVLDRKTIGSLDKFLFTLINEFGCYVDSSAFYEGYLNEYGQLIILGNALDVIKAYFG